MKPLLLPILGLSLLACDQDPTALPSDSSTPESHSSEEAPAPKQGQGRNPALVDAFGLEFVPLASYESFEFTTRYLDGSGSLLNRRPFKSTKEDRNFEIEFYLEDGGFVELATFTNGQMKNGLYLHLEREGDALISTLISEPRSREVDIGSYLTARSQDGHWRLSVDVHNSHNHVIIWNGLEPREELYDSNLDTQAPGSGSGSFWGLRFHKALITDLKVSGARDSH